LIPMQQLYLGHNGSFIQTLFGKDDEVASVSWARNVDLKEYGYAYSLFLSQSLTALQTYRDSDLAQLFPRGIPSAGGPKYVLGTALDWIGGLLPTLPQPILGYFHFLPPHYPYRTSREFFNAFAADGYKAPRKPDDIFARPKVPEQILSERRREYDEFVLYVDSEFNRFYEALESSGILENSWLVVTTDHGELFERGIMGHVSLALYDPVIRIPLMIFEPGRASGMDIHDPTSAIDLLPTLAQLTGHLIPDWCEGRILPPFEGTAEHPRDVYAVLAYKNPQDAPLKLASIALIRETTKLTYYMGYDEVGGGELAKLYDIQADPEELTDLSSSQKSTVAELLGKIKDKLAQADQPYL
jgi:arylsulfatase A-like enzyme